MKAASYLGVSPLAFLAWPARWLWLAAAASRIDAEQADAARDQADSLAARLQQRQRAGGVTATPLYEGSN